MEINKSNYITIHRGEFTESYDLTKMCGLEIYKERIWLKFSGFETELHPEEISNYYEVKEKLQEYLGS